MDDLDTATGSDIALHKQRAYATEMMLAMSRVELEIVPDI